MVIALVLGVTACGGPSRDLAPVPVPDVSTFERGVRTRLAAARATFDKVAAGHPTDEQLGRAYGELGMTYHAQGVSGPAIVAYRNAHLLAPGDKRWPYLLAQLYADAGNIPEAIAAIESTLKIDPNDAPAQISLGRLYLKQGLPDKAKPAFERAKSVSAARAAALTGLGKVALAQGRHREAIGDFEEALKITPAATRLRQPLALAYRAIGDEAGAERNLQQFTAEGLEPGVPDPVLDEVSARAASYRVLLAKGQYAGTIGRYDLAEQAFREAVDGDPANVEAVTNLGIAIANLGRLEEAQRTLERAVQLDDSNASAHLNLGLVFDRQGQDELAMKQYELARRDAKNIQARVYLGDAKMRTALPMEAAAIYREALALSPDSIRIQVSLAMALLDAKQFVGARSVLESALKGQPSNPDVTNILARVLATSPPASVRDGARALRMATALYDTIKDPAVAQTKAMALAETGHFAEAIALQGKTVQELQQAGSAGTAAFASDALERYRRHQPLRRGWAEDDPAFRPRSPAVQLAEKQPVTAR